MYLLVATIALYLYENPQMRCDKRIQWIKDGRDEGWLQPLLGVCSNLQDAYWGDIEFPPYSKGMLFTLFI